MDSIDKAILNLEKKLKSIDKFHRAVDTYLKVEPYRLIYEALNLENLPLERRRHLLIEARTLMRRIEINRENLKPGLEDNLLLLAWLLMLFPEPFLSDAMGLGVIGLWALIKKAKGERVDPSTIRCMLKQSMERLTKDRM